MTKHLRLFCIVAAFLFSATLLATNAWAQEAPAEAPPAPVPVQITSAKKIFISNAGVEGYSANGYSGSPNRTYNEFYAAMKTWGQLQIVATPAEADVIFEIVQVNLPNGNAVPIPQLTARILDPKTRVTLWVVTVEVKVANLPTTAKKNYDVAMTEFVNQVKILVLPAAPAAKN
jgi:hypothetical protein